MFYRVSFTVGERRLSDAINVLHDYGPVQVGLAPETQPAEPYPLPEGTRGELTKMQVRMRQYWNGPKGQARREAAAARRAKRSQQ
jgi:hypothetical protein